MNNELRRLVVNQPAGAAELETIAVYHSKFSKAYHIVRNLPGGFIGRLETGEDVEFMYVPMKYGRASMEGDFDYGLTITMQDLNEIIAPELDRIPVDDEEIPIVIARSFIYRRDRSISTVADGPFRLEIGDVSFSHRGCSFRAEAQPLNRSATGIMYTVQDIPMLEGYIL